MIEMVKEEAMKMMTKMTTIMTILTTMTLTMWRQQNGKRINQLDRSTRMLTGAETKMAKSEIAKGVKLRETKGL